MVEYCVCGHLATAHIRGRGCAACIDWMNIFDSKNEHTFKLDNLKLIEDLAKERKLI